jgi:hypothetical protein
MATSTRGCKEITTEGNAGSVREEFLLLSSLRFSKKIALQVKIVLPLFFCLRSKLSLD